MPPSAAGALAEAERLYRGGRVGPAIDLLRKATKKNPRGFDLQMTLGSICQQAGRTDEARAAFDAAARLAPRSPEAHFFLAAALEDSGDRAAAIGSYARALDLKPDYIEALVNFGVCQLDEGEPEAAIEPLEKAVVIAPGIPQAWHALGLARRAAGRMAEAAEAYETLLKANPDDADAHVNLGGTLQELGRFADAEQHLTRAIALKPDLVEAHYQLLRNRKVKEADRVELERLAARLDAGDLAEKDRTNLHFALGKAYDDLAEADTAFAHFEAGNRLVRERLPYSHRQTDTELDEIAAVFDAALIEARAAEGHDSARPIFIVGMPRSGTTLVEQIVASHPDVFGAGELPVIGKLAARLRDPGTGARYPTCVPALPADALTETAEAYLDRLSELDEDAPRMTDKMPSNFLHLGLIAILFPNARVIHCRRDPVDTCLSCYFQHFNQPVRFAYDLADLGHYHVACDRLMAHWAEVLPRPPLTVAYEELVADQERVSREIIAYLGLEWDDRCLRYHETERTVGTASVWQVRQPIYTSSVKKWQRYEPHLKPLLEALAAGNAEQSG